jgi:hypothetical protein
MIYTLDRFFFQILGINSTEINQRIINTALLLYHNDDNNIFDSKLNYNNDDNNIINVHNSK